MKKKLVILIMALFAALSFAEQNFDKKEEAYYQVCEDGEACEPETLKEYLLDDYSKLNSKQRKKAEEYFSELQEYEFSEYFDEDEYYIMLDEFNSMLRTYGAKVPFFSLKSYLESIEDRITVQDFSQLLENNERLLRNFEKLEITNNEKRIKKLENRIEVLENNSEEILAKYDIDYNEVISQIETGVIQTALFDIKNGNLKLSKESLVKSEDITNEEMKKYERVFSQIKLIYPEHYLNKIDKIEFNTDGGGRGMAAMQPDEEVKTWRLSIDIKDCFDENGEFHKELAGTLIHESAHLITLNDEQLKPHKTEDIYDFEERYKDSKTYVTNEGILHNKSYLNKFYNQFWKDIYEEHMDLTMSMDDYEYFDDNKFSDEDHEFYGDPMDEFYEKYKDQFVSDYAVTNPEEDIAESYRLFVLEDKPSGNCIADEKIRFFYEFSKLVNYRKKIRKALGL